MIGWRDRILNEFTPEVARLTLVADPDQLLTEEGVLQGIRERGFELIPFEDPMAFRFAYESNYRSLWDRGERTDLVVALRAPKQELSSLPYDLLQAGRKLSFNLGDLFPNLSYPVVDALDRADLNAVYQAHARHLSEKLGDNGTKSFVLRHLFGFTPDLVNEASDLLQVLLKRHYRGKRIPPLLEARMVEVLREKRQFDLWPLEQIVPDRQAFLAFLQERWPLFLRLASGDRERKITELPEGYGLRYAGPADLPFDHEDVRVYVGTFFLEGALQPVELQGDGLPPGGWVDLGIKSDPEGDASRRLSGLLDLLEGSLPGPGALHQEWIEFAQRLAEMLAVWYTTKTAIIARHDERVSSLRRRVDEVFFDWVVAKYGNLHNLPSNPPAMVHHIPRYLAKTVFGSQYSANSTSQSKVALVVVDGLALDQWVVIREQLKLQRPDWRFREDALFCWVPTTTAVSRQALFAGKPPIYFPTSLQTTGKDGTLWAQFWTNQGMAPGEVDYRRGLGDGGLDNLDELLSGPKLRAVGLVINAVDDIMHGMKLGAAGMHNQVRQWVDQGWLANMIDLLMSRGFAVHLTSDHGNVEAIGRGSLSEGAIADHRGERVRVYPSPELRRQVREKCLEAIEWPPIGLPADFLPLLAPDRQAFVQVGERIVGHGGITIEELIVPLITIEPTVK